MNFIGVPGAGRAEGVLAAACCKKSAFDDSTGRLLCRHISPGILATITHTAGRKQHGHHSLPLKSGRRADESCTGWRRRWAWKCSMTSPMLRMASWYSIKLTPPLAQPAFSCTLYALSVMKVVMRVTSALTRSGRRTYQQPAQPDARILNAAAQAWQPGVSGRQSSRDLA